MKVEKQTYDCHTVVEEIEVVYDTSMIVAFYPTHSMVMEISMEDIFMDADRQKLELDITKEFEFADGEATLLIDEAK